MTTVQFSGRGQVVVVETDDLIRELIECWLAAEGFTVVADIPASPATVLVIVDVPRPGHAEGALKALSNRYHPAPVLAISARFRRGLAGSADAAARLGVHEILPKPFIREELLGAVAQALRPR